MSTPPLPAAAAATRLRLRDVGVTPAVALVVILLTLAAQLGTFGFTLMLMHVMDGVVETRNADTIIAFALLFLFAAVVSGIFTHMRGTLLAAAADRLGLRLQAAALQAAIRNAVRTDTGEGLSVLQDIAQIRRFLSSRAPTSFLDLISAGVCLAILFFIDTGLGLVTLLGVVLTTLLGFVMYRVTRRLVAESQRKFQDTSSELSGQLVHPDLVRGIGLLPATMFRWQGRYDDALGSVDGAQRRVNALLGIEEMLSDLCSIAIMVYACHLIFSHAGTTGVLMAAYMLTSSVISPFTMVFRNWESWAYALQARRRLQAVLQQDGAPPVLPPVPDAPPGLMVEDLTFWPEGRDRAIVGGVTLRLPPGTAVIVQGPNGVGKSTLLRLAMGLLRPSSGRVLLNGQDTTFCDRATLGARIGYLPQDVQLLEGTVYDNIGRGPDAPAEAVVAAARVAGAHDMIGRLPMGYQTPSGATSGLSAGQRRLIGLARALYGDPDLLVLDEPEVGLDGLARAAMRGAVQATRQRGGVVLIVTHEPRTWLDVTELRLILGPGGTWQVQPVTQAADEMGASLAAIG
jgi:ATP-binding cassette subfamily C protein